MKGNKHIPNGRDALNSVEKNALCQKRAMLLN